MKATIKKLGIIVWIIIFYSTVNFLRKLFFIKTNLLNKESSAFTFSTDWKSWFQKQLKFQEKQYSTVKNYQRAAKMKSWILFQNLIAGLGFGRNRWSSSSRKKISGGFATRNNTLNRRPSDINYWIIHCFATLFCELFFSANESIVRCTKKKLK